MVFVDVNRVVINGVCVFWVVKGNINSFVFIKIIIKKFSVNNLGKDN